MNSRIVIGLGELLVGTCIPRQELAALRKFCLHLRASWGTRELLPPRSQDDLGQQAHFVREGRLGGETGEIQTDPIHPTGTSKFPIEKTGRRNSRSRNQSHGNFLEWDRGMERAGENGC